MTPTQYVATLRQRWHPSGHSDAEIASWLVDESKGLFEDLHEDVIRQPTCTAVQEVTRYADFLSACVRQIYNQSSRGRPRGPASFRDRADLEKHLIQIISYMDKHQYNITHEVIACTLRLLLKPGPRDDLAHMVARAACEHNEAKAATTNLHRWCNYYGTKLNPLIHQVRTS